MREECGVFAVAGHKDAAYLTYVGLLALQHRGQEATGMVTYREGDIFTLHKDLGLVADVFSKGRLADLHGQYALGHVRYSTKGGNNRDNAQPHKAGNLWVASNGDVVNYTSQRMFLEQNDLTFYSTNDGELLAKNILFNSQRKGGIIPGILQMMNHVHGTYSAGLLTNKRMYALRDPAGIRPLVMGIKDGKGVLSSETCALDSIGAKYVREVLPGEIVDLETLTSMGVFEKAENPGRICIFEYIYFARPDSKIREKLLWQARFDMGRQLAIEDPEKDSDIIVPVPETGNPGAAGFAAQSGVPLIPAIIKNHYVGRTFIQPEQSQRMEAVRIKLNVMSEMVKGKNVKVIEDSIVRGTTSGILIQKLRDAGAAKVSLAITSPPIRFPCYYGIDTGVRKDLIASELTVDEVRKHIGADHLQYLTYEGLLKSCGGKQCEFCTACLNGDYPIAVKVGNSLPGKAEWEEGRQGV